MRAALRVACRAGCGGGGVAASLAPKASSACALLRRSRRASSSVRTSTPFTYFPRSRQLMNCGVADVRALRGVVGVDAARLAVDAGVTGVEPLAGSSGAGVSCFTRAGSPSPSATIRASVARSIV